MSNETATPNETAEALKNARVALIVEARVIEAEKKGRAPKAEWWTLNPGETKVEAAKSRYLVASEAWLACDVHSESRDALCDAAQAAADDLRMARWEVEVIKVERRRIKE